MGISKFREFINKKADDIDAYFYPKSYRIKNFIENQSVSDIREVLYNFTDEFNTSSINYSLWANDRFMGLNINKGKDRFCDGDYIFNTVRKFSDQNKKIEFEIRLELNDDRFNDTNQSMENYELGECSQECGEQLQDMCNFDSFRYSRERNSWGRPVCKMMFTF